MIRSDKLCGTISLRDAGFFVLGVTLFTLVFYGLVPEPEAEVFDWRIVTMQKEYENMDDSLFLIPGDDVLDRVNEAEMLKIYWRYVNSIQTVCNNIIRFGDFLDGGKEICVEERFVPSKPCIAYSFGCGFHFEFENAVYRTFGCRTFTFDPTIDIKGKEHLIPKYVNLTLEGLSGKDETLPNGWRMKTLKTFFKERNHKNSVIDFLKIDVEGSEWPALTDAFKTDILSRVRQLSIEVHYGRFRKNKPTKTRPIYGWDPLWGDAPAKQQLVVLRTLFEKGFRIFARERNTNSVCKPSTTAGLGTITTVNELYFINTKFKPYSIGRHTK